MKQVTATVTHQVTSILTFEIPDDQAIDDSLREIISEWPLSFTVDEGGDDNDGYALTEIYVMAADAPSYKDVDVAEVGVPA